MTTTADICRIVLEEHNPLIDEVYERVGVGERTGEALLKKLCGEGALKRDRDRLMVAGSGIVARRLAADASPARAPADKPPAANNLPVLSMAAPKPVRRELPIPAAIAVRKDVPLPPSSVGIRARPSPWPFDSLVDIGDSFAVDVAEGFTAKRYASAIKAAADAYAKKHPGFRVAIRTALDGSWVGAWREAPPVKPENVAPITSGSLGIRARKAGGK